MLTAEECKVAAERARKYPPTYGHSYLARTLTGEEESILGDIDNPFGDGLSNAAAAARWLSVHPEDHAIG